MDRFPIRPGSGWNWWAAFGLAAIVVIGVLGASGNLKVGGQEQCEAKGGVLAGANTGTSVCLDGEQAIKDE